MARIRLTGLDDEDCTQHPALNNRSWKFWQFLSVVEFPDSTQHKSLSLIVASCPMIVLGARRVLHQARIKWANTYSIDVRIIVNHLRQGIRTEQLKLV